MDTAIKVRILNANQVAEIEAATQQGQPVLVIGSASQYQWLYDDSGSGSHMDGSIFRPLPAEADVFIIGDMAQGYYGDPQASSLTVKAINDSSAAPMLATPTGYVQVWDDRGSGGHHDGAVWQPLAPDGYIAIGAVASNGYQMPSIPNYRCLREDLVTTTTAGTLIWDDSGSGAHEDVELYTLQGVNGAFLAEPDYNPPTGNYYQLKPTS